MPLFPKGRLTARPDGTERPLRVHAALYTTGDTARYRRRAGFLHGDPGTARIAAGRETRAGRHVCDRSHRTANRKLTGEGAPGNVFQDLLSVVNDVDVVALLLGNLRRLAANAIGPHHVDVVAGDGNLANVCHDDGPAPDDSGIRQSRAGKRRASNSQ